MCKQHWERIMGIMSEKHLPETVNLLEVRTYMYACYLEDKLTTEEWDAFEARAVNIDSSLLLATYGEDKIEEPRVIGVQPNRRRWRLEQEMTGRQN